MRSQSSSHSSSPALLAAFFLSGVAGLAHEVAWTRVLRHVMGNTTFAVTTVLMVFMGGLALGSWAAGRWIDRRRDPVRVFALLEGGIGLTCLALPFAIRALQPLYASLYHASGGSFLLLSGARVLFCSLVLLPTATMMGATLPILVRALVGATGAVGASVGRLYSINTLGAVCGTVLAGFALMPNLGLWGTILTASALNAVVCAIGLRLHAAQGPLPEEAPRVVPAQGDAVRAPAVLLVGYALSGAAALAYEVVWTRVLASMIGSSVYAFSMMLTAFLLGLALGSLLFARWSDRVRDPLRALVKLQLGIALGALAVVPLFSNLPFWFADLLARSSESWWQLQAREFAALVGIMVVPTTLMGATFPLVSRLWAQSRGQGAARAVGAIYSANTLGSIAGSALAGFLLVPLLGSQHALYLAVLANAVVAALFAASDASWAGAGRKVALASPLGLAGVMLLLPRWNPVEMYFGSFFIARRNPTLAKSEDELRKWVREDEVLLHEEGIDTTVTVRRDPNGGLALLVNGKPDAGTGADVDTQVLLGQLPLCLHPDPERVLVIGLASGITLGAVAQHDVQQIDCAEISDSVVRACRLFDEHNHRVLDDPRVRILVADGRNHLALSGETYDVIVSEPSNPWIVGVADLFTREFFQAAHDALNEGGLACVWMERYAIDEHSFRSVVRTFHEVFPSMTIWSPDPTGSDYMLIGARDQLSIDVTKVAEHLASPRVAADLARVRISDPTSLLGLLVTGPAGAARLGEGVPLHTDDNALLEFAAPRSMLHSDTHDALVAAIEAQRGDDLAFLHGELPTSTWRSDVAQWIAARGRVVQSILARQHGRAQEADVLLQQAEAVAPASAKVAPAGTAAGELARAHSLLQAGDLPQALVAYQAGLALDPTHVQLNLELAQVYLQTGAYDQALPPLETVVAAYPDNATALEQLSFLLSCTPSLAQRDPVRALSIAEGLYQREGEKALVLRTLSAAQAANGQFEEAQRTIGVALDLARESDMQMLVPFLEQMQQSFAARRPWSI